MMDLVKLREVLVANFSEAELRDLCFDLRIDFQGLPGQSKNDKARELIAYCDRHHRLTELVETVYKRRPKAFRPGTATPISVGTPPPPTTANWIVAGGLVVTALVIVVLGILFIRTLFAPSSTPAAAPEATQTQPSATPLPTFTPVPSTPTPMPTATPGPTAVPTAPVMVALNWGPKECLTSDPLIVYGECGKYRDLDWLKGQFQRIKSAGVEGFRQLPDQFMLRTKDNSTGSKNWLLYVVDSRGALLHNVNVGYPLMGGIRLNSPDGAVQISPWLFMDTAEQWWTRDAGDSYQLVVKAK